MTIIIVSARPVDILFCQKIARHEGMEVILVRKGSELRHALNESIESVVFWDVDHPSAIVALHPLSIQSVTSVLQKHGKAERTFVVSDNPLNTMPYLFNVPSFNHHIYRRYA